MEDIGEDVDGGGYVGVESLCVVNGVLTLRAVLASIQPIRIVPTYRCVGVQVATHVLDFQLQLLLCSVAGTLTHHQSLYLPCGSQLNSTLKARCSKK